MKFKFIVYTISFFLCYLHIEANVKTKLDSKNKIFYRTTYDFVVYEIKTKSTSAMNTISKTLKALLVDQLKVLPYVYISNPEVTRIIYSEKSILEDGFRDIKKGEPTFYSLNTINEKSDTSSFCRDFCFKSIIQFDRQKKYKFIGELKLKEKKEPYQFKVLFSADDLPLASRLVAAAIRKEINQGHVATMQLQGKPNISLYLNNRFYARLPVTIVNFPTTYIELHAKSLGYLDYREKIKVVRGEIVQKKIVLKSEILQNNINIESIPSGVKVYKGVDYIGRTPLKKIKIAKGVYHFKFILKGYLNNSRTVSIKEKETNIKLRMQPGDETNHLVIAPNVLGPFSAKQVFYGSLATSTFLAIGGIVGLTQVDKYNDRKGQYMLTGDNQNVAIASKRSLNFQYLSSGLFISSSLAFISAAYYFWLYIEQKDKLYANNLFLLKKLNPDYGLFSLNTIYLNKSIFDPTEKSLQVNFKYYF